MTVHDLLKGWQNFWFKPQSPLSIASFRIVFGLVFLTQILTQFGRDFSVFFGAQPIIRYEDFIAYFWKKDLIINIFEFLPTQGPWHLAVFVVMTVSTIMMIVGLYTRVSTFITYILFCSITHQFPFLCNAGDDMQRIVLLLLCFSRAGDAISIDSIVGKPKKDWYRACFAPKESAPWAQRLLQVQMAVTYISTALLKINSDPWFTANGLYYATRLTDFTKFSFPVLFDHRFSLYLLNWFAILCEFSLGILVWIKEWKYWVLLTGFLFHLGIDWTMNIPIFEFVFIAMYVLFIEPEDIEKVVNWFKLLTKHLKWKPAIN